MPFLGPSAGSVHIDRALTNLSVGHIQRPDAFVAMRVFPFVPVPKQSDYYFTYSIADLYRDEAKTRAPGTESEGFGYAITTGGPFFCANNALHVDVPDDIERNADAPIQPLQNGAQILIQKMRIRREALWASTFFVTGIWTTEYAGVSSSPSSGQFLQWNDGASTPVEDIRTGITAVHAATGFRPNVLTLGRYVYDKLIDHPDIVGRLDRGQTSGTATVTRQSLAALFELDEVLVCDAVKNSGKPGGTTSISFIAGKNALLSYRPQSAGIMVPSAGYTFAWSGAPGAMNDVGVVTSRFRMEHLKSWRVESEHYIDQKVISADLGAFFLDAVA